MKKYLLILTAASMVFAIGCKKTKKEEPAGTNYVVEPKQNSVVVYFGGTWCPPCGAYGKPAKEQILAANPNVVMLSNQVSGGGTDPMNNADANAMATIFGVSSVPVMFVGGANTSFKSYLGGNIVASSVNADIATINAKTPVATSKFTATMTGSMVNVHVTTQFYQDETLEYYLACYLTESGLVYTQSSDASAKKNIHDMVLRKTLSFKGTGDLMKTGPKKDEVVTTDFGYALDPSWKKENMKVQVVLWQKNAAGQFSATNGVVGTIQ